MTIPEGLPPMMRSRWDCTSGRERRLSDTRQFTVGNRGGKMRTGGEWKVGKIRNRLLPSLSASDLSLPDRHLHESPIKHGLTPGVRGPTHDAAACPETAI